MSDNQLALEADGARFPRDHNQPPLAERLAEEIVPFRTRFDELAGVAATAAIIDEESARKIIDLIGLCRTHLEEVEAAHEKEMAPYRAAAAEINAAYGPIMQSLKAIIGVDARSGLRGTLTEFERRRAAAADAERQRLIAERAQREAEAEAARRAAEDKKAAGGSGLADELQAMQAEEQAKRLAERAGAIRPTPIRAALGNVGTQRQIAFEITDLRKLCGWLLKSSIRPTLEEAARQIMARWLRGLGVEAVQKGVGIPGLEARIEDVARVRR